MDQTKFINSYINNLAEQLKAMTLDNIMLKTQLAIANETIPFHGLSIVPMVLALLRYLLVLENGGGGAPEEVFFNDRWIQAYGAVWVVVYGLAVYAS